AAGKLYRCAQTGSGRTRQHLRFRRAAGLSALHASCGISRPERARSVDWWESRADSPLATAEGAGENAAQSSRLAGKATTERGRQRDIEESQHLVISSWYLATAFDIYVCRRRRNLFLIRVLGC